MIRDFISNTKSKKELDKLFKITGSSVLANIRKDGKQFKSEKYVSILENLNYDTYLRLPEKLQEIITKELNSLIRYYKDSDFNTSLRIIKDENDVSIRSSEDLLGVAKTISSNTNNIKNEGKQKLKNMQKLSNRVFNVISLCKQNALKMGIAVFLMWILSKGSYFFGSGFSVIQHVGTIFFGGCAVLNAWKIGKLIKTAVKVDDKKTITVKGKTFKIAKTRRIKKEKNVDKNLEKEDIFLEEQPILENTEPVFLEQDIESNEKDISITDEAKKVYESLLNSKAKDENTDLIDSTKTINSIPITDESKKVYESLLTSKVKEKNTGKTLQNLEESKTELEKYRELVSKIKDLNDSLTRSLNFFKSDLLMITYQNNGLSHRELYKTVPIYRKRYLQKNKCERELKECEIILRFISKVITPTTNEKSLSDSDIEILNDISNKYKQIQEKSRKF